MFKITLTENEKCFFPRHKKNAKYAALNSHQLCENISNYWVFEGVYGNFPSNAFWWNACVGRCIMRCEMASSSAEVSPAVLMLYGGRGGQCNARLTDQVPSTVTVAVAVGDLLEPTKFLIQPTQQRPNAENKRSSVRSAKNGETSLSLMTFNNSSITGHTTPCY